MRFLLLLVFVLFTTGCSSFVFNARSNGYYDTWVTVDKNSNAVPSGKHMVDSAAEDFKPVRKVLDRLGYPDYAKYYPFHFEFVYKKSNQLVTFDGHGDLSRTSKVYDTNSLGYSSLPPQFIQYKSELRKAKKLAEIQRKREADRRKREAEAKKREERRKRQIAERKRIAERVKQFEIEEAARKLAEEKEKKKLAELLKREAELVKRSFSLRYKSLLKNSEFHKEKTLVFKGFYLGMPISDAFELLNYYTKQAQILSDEDLKANGFSIEEISLLKKSRSKNRYQMSTGGLKIEATMAAVDPIVVADESGKVINFSFTPLIMDYFYDISELEDREFVKNFTGAYSLNSFDYKLEAMKVVTNIVGYQHIYTSRNMNKAFQAVFYGKQEASNPAASLFSSSRSRGTFIVSKMISSKEVKSKFN